ncbi:MAG: regulatory protein RecX [Ruminococcaceae bacterium]|nr:regulatory protein RecX [Oscillospiraceae bacterium]
MLITDLKKDKKHLTKLLLSNGEEVLLDNDVCAENCLKSGAEIDSQRLKELKHESDYKRAKSRALWYLDRMDYTEKNLFDKLIKAGFSKKISAEVLAWLKEFDLVDDVRYAERFAERCKESNISKRECVHKMLQKGIPYDLAKQVTEELETDEEAQINALIERKYARKLLEERGTEKVFAALARKGFDFSAIKAALKKFNEELEFSEEI